MYDAQLDSHSDFAEAAAAPAGYRNAAAAIAGQRGSAALHATLLLSMLDEIDYGLVVLGADGELALSFVPLNSGLRSAAEIPEAPLALLIFGKRDACEALTLQQYGQLHGLTGAEQALLPAISRGLGVEAIAQQQCVALSTVRTQLGSIREKTGVTSLRMLMARLNNLPPLRPSRFLTQAH